jgi:hypothetical protein
VCRVRLKTLARGERKTAQEVGGIQAFTACALQLGDAQHAFAASHAHAVFVSTQHGACWFVVCGAFHCGAPQFDDVFPQLR